MTPRDRLPDRRQSYATDFWHGRDDKNGKLGLHFHASASIYRLGRDGVRWGEIFLTCYSDGPIGSFAADMATIASIALQHGATVQEIKKSLSKATLRDSGEKVEDGAPDDEFYVSPIGPFLDLLEAWRTEFETGIAA